MPTLPRSRYRLPRSMGATIVPVHFGGAEPVLTTGTDRTSFMIPPSSAAAPAPAPSSSPFANWTPEGKMFLVGSGLLIFGIGILLWRDRMRRRGRR